MVVIEQTYRASKMEAVGRSVLTSAVRVRVWAPLMSFAHRDKAPVSFPIEQLTQPLLPSHTRRNGQRITHHDFSTRTMLRRPLHPRPRKCKSHHLSPYTLQLTRQPGHSRKGTPTSTLHLCHSSIRHLTQTLHNQFKKLLTPGKIGQILCLGNLTSPSVYTFLRNLAPDLQLVKGDFDISISAPTPPNPNTAYAPPTEQPSIPTALSKVVTHGGLRIGFTHGHTIVPPGDPDSLLIAARQMDVDVLCWGGTCEFSAYEMEGKFFINPGSATGAVSWSHDAELDANGEEVSVPSFVLMDVSSRASWANLVDMTDHPELQVQGDVLVLYVYQLRKDQNGVENVAVEKVSYRKNASSS
jgi:vacuolar protein sorting-associated protein 29